MAYLSELCPSLESWRDKTSTRFRLTTFSSGKYPRTPRINWARMHSVQNNLKSLSKILEKFYHAKYPLTKITGLAGMDLSASKNLKLLRKRSKQQKKMRVSALSSSIQSWKVRLGRPSTLSSSKTCLPLLILSKGYLTYLLPLAQSPRTLTNRLTRVTSTSFASETATQKTENTVHGVRWKLLKRCMESFYLVL